MVRIGFGRDGAGRMSEDIQQLISDVAEVTGSSAPAIMAADAPVFQAQPMRGPAGPSVYFIGLIGGKDVGKSALINAIVGMPISESTAFGPGTETIVAYVHKSQQAAVKALLEPIAPGRFSIVTHAIDRLVCQVLLDLPDIDS